MGGINLKPLEKKKMEPTGDSVWCGEVKFYLQD